MARFDAVVIGSGFGGAVVASRLAQAGRSVCVLEQGRRWPPATYPRTFGQSASAVWDGRRRLGFLEYRVFSRIDVIQGVGVGGGSLHYFNVQLRAPAEIFDRPEWPAPLSRAVLDPYYERAEAMMTPGPLVPPAGETMPERTEAFLRGASGAGFQPALVPIAVHTGPAREHPVSGLAQQPCTYDAGCLLGCRSGAKNSLDMTYLPAGERAGMVIRPLHAVERIEPARDGRGYVVVARVLDEVNGATVAGEERLEATSVVVAAGTLGSTELLLRARDHNRSLPGLSPALGRRFSGNGDMLFGGTKNVDVDVHPSRGPSITAGAFVNRAGSSNLVQIQDLGYPSALMSLFDATLPTRPRLKALGRAVGSYVGAARGGDQFRSVELFGGSPVPRFLPFLGMGTDAADGRFRLDHNGALRLDWDPQASMAMFAEMEDGMRAISAALGGQYFRSALWRRPLRRLLTAHPLGGCVMSDSPATGVVDHHGEVFGHPGLFVVDGSAIPGPLAVNPSLTIAAVAERCAEWMLHGRDPSNIVA